MKHRRVRLSLLVSSSLLVAACGAPDDPPDEAPGAVLAAEEDGSATRTGTWSSAGLPPAPRRRPFRLPRRDDVLALLAKEGRTSINFMECVSKGEGQPTIASTESLPVGGGRHLECSTRPPTLPATTVQQVQSASGAFYCFLGAAAEYRTSSDARLDARLVSAPADGQWSVRVTSDTAWEVEPVNALFGTIAWPVWLEVHYRTVDIRPMRRNSCDDVF